MIIPAGNPACERRAAGRRLPFALLAAVSLAIACGGKDHSGEGGATPPATTAVPSTAVKVSASYVRGPQHDRVIIFVNGIFGDATGTWTNAATGKYWPALVAADPAFADADVYVHSFLSPHLATAQDIQELAGRMKDVLETQGVISSHKQLVFLCHSMGGLITRAFLLAERLPVEKVPMIYFFATPTAGANVAEIGTHLSENPQLKDMEPLDEGGYVKNLREQWLLTSNDPALNYPNRIASFCSYERKDTWGFLVVTEVSATYLCNHETRAVVEDHLGIVKPADENADPYVFFKAAYERQFSPEAAPIRTALAMHSTTPFAAASREVSIGQFRARELVLKQVKPSTQSIEVGCGQEKNGVLDAKVDLAPGERVTEVTATLANASNLKPSSAAIVRQSNGAATVSYAIRGLDGAGCAGGGHADVVVNFVVSRAPAVAPGVPLHPGVAIPVSPARPMRPEVEVPVKGTEPIHHPIREFVVTPVRTRVP